MAPKPASHESIEMESDRVEDVVQLYVDCTLADRFVAQLGPRLNGKKPEANICVTGLWYLFPAAESSLKAL